MMSKIKSKWGVMENFKKYTLTLYLCTASLGYASIRVISPQAGEQVEAQDFDTLRQGIADVFDRDVADLGQILAIRFEDGIPITTFLEDEMPPEIYDFLNDPANNTFVVALFAP